MRHFFAQVAGESFRNDDGSDRQTVIAGCRVGDPLILSLEPDNPHDENAVRVLREDGRQIGHLERSMAARLADDLSDFHAFVAGVGRARGRYLGVALLVVVSDGEGDVEGYARQVLAEDRDVPVRRSRRASGRGDGGDPTDSSLIFAVIGLIALAVVIGVALRWWLVQ